MNNYNEQYTLLINDLNDSIEELIKIKKQLEHLYLEKFEAQKK